MKRLKISAAILAVSAIIVCLFTYSKIPTATTANSGTLLWQVTSHNQDAPSYLYGTIHLMPEKDFFLGEDAIKCLEASKSLTLEVDLDIPIKEQIKMAQRMMLPQNKSLKDYMSGEDYKLLHSYLMDSIGIKEGKIERYAKLKPFNLLGIVCLEYYDNIKMYEKEFTTIAKKNDISINELEDIETQLSIIEDSGLDMETPSGKDIYVINEYEKLKNIYMKKDLDALTQFLSNEFEKEPNVKLEEQLISDRNKNWIPKLDSIMLSEATFIAVGAGHLGGEKGLINLLREEGYTVTSVNQ